MTQSPTPAARKPSVRSHHGHDFTDEYEWMREKESPELIEWLQSENAFTDSELARLEPLRQSIFEEIKGRTLETDLSVPVREGDWWYFVRTAEGSQYTSHCRVAAAGPDDWTPPSIDGALEGEEVLLDENVEAEEHEFFSLGTLDVSADGRSILYGIDVEGDERYTLRVRPIGGGDPTDEIPLTSGRAMFSPDGRFVFYVTVDDAWRPHQLWRHEIGSDADDVLVFAEPDEKYWVHAYVTRSLRYLIVDSGSILTSEVSVIDMQEPTGAPSVVWPKRDGVEYSVEHAVIGGVDRFVITHNDGAENFEICMVDVADPTGERMTVVASRDDTRIGGVEAFADRLVVVHRRDALSRVAVLEIGADGALGTLTEIDFDEPLFTVRLGSNPEWLQPTVRVSFASFITPASVYNYDPVTGDLHLLKRQPVIGYDPADYRQRREWATAADGTRIPISVVWKATTDLSTPRATLLYGYGSYESSMDPALQVSRLSLLDRGMVFALAHVRGGGEMGRHWYEQGKLLDKRNTFTDFISAADHLVECGITDPQRLVAEGRSAGGLLMGAVANLAPERFTGILAGVPFVDALTSMLDPTLPLTVTEWDEWGDPFHDADVYEYMRGYSPYENVRSDASYPKMLVTSSLNDTRVLYVEPAKWVAKLREVHAPVLLKMEMGAGHFGVSGRYEAWKQRAFDYAWVVDAAGLA